MKKLHEIVKSEYAMGFQEDFTRAGEIFEIVDDVAKVGCLMVVIVVIVAYLLYRRSREFDEIRDGINKYDKF